MPKDSQPVADIAIIGSGVASTYTLIALFEKLLSDNDISRSPIQITVIERYQEMWKGIPYGNRSSVNALTITTLQDFFTSDNERADFFAWFLPQKSRLLKAYVRLGGTIAANWYKSNEQAISNNSWDNIYFPRYIIGNYITQKFDKLKQQIEIKGFAYITIIHGDAVAIKPNGTLKKIIITNQYSQTDIVAKKIILATGSAPVKKLTAAFDHQSDVMYINELHHKNLAETMKIVAENVNEIAEDARNVLIIGSNADCIEFLYLLQNTDDLINTITILSSGGKFPGHITYDHYSHNITTNLDKLAEKLTYSIEQLVGAATKDIIKVTGHRVSVPDVDFIISKTIDLLEPLDIASKKLFYGVYGVQLARIFRRAGTDYKKAADNLLEKNKLLVLKGNFFDLKYNPDGTTTLAYKGEDEKISYLTKKFKIVINCTGSDNLINSSSPLIRDLIENNSCKVNLSGKAFDLKDNLEAAPGIYVIGPLAGGNYNRLLYFWHLENASRIIYLSKYLAKELLR